MNLVACMLARNEEHELGLTLRAALKWCDLAVVLNHASTDHTADIIAEVHRETGRVICLSDSHTEWREMPMRQRMLECARDNAATHIALVDSDEILTGNLLPRVRELISVCPRGSTLQLQLPGYNLRHGIHQYHSNGIWGNRWFSTAFPDMPSLGWSGDRFHSREPGPQYLHPFRPVAQGGGGVMHLWGANERRLIAKHRKFRIEEATRWPEKPHAEIETMYSWATDGTGPADCPETWTFNAVPESWWAPYLPWMEHLHLDAVPWQEEDCERLIAGHGREYFKGLRV